MNSTCAEQQHREPAWRKGLLTTSAKRLPLLLGLCASQALKGLRGGYDGQVHTEFLA